MESCIESMRTGEFRRPPSQHFAAHVFVHQSQSLKSRIGHAHMLRVAVVCAPSYDNPRFASQPREHMTELGRHRPWTLAETLPVQVEVMQQQFARRPTPRPRIRHRLFDVLVEPREKGQEFVLCHTS